MNKIRPVCEGELQRCPSSHFRNLVGWWTLVTSFQLAEGSTKEVRGMRDPWWQRTARSQVPSSSCVTAAKSSLQQLLSPAAQPGVNWLSCQRARTIWKQKAMVPILDWSEWLCWHALNKATVTIWFPDEEEVSILPYTPTIYCDWPHFLVQLLITFTVMEHTVCPSRTSGDRENITI